jgi:hypothetical protein
MATRVSWALEEMIISLLMPVTPWGPWDTGAFDDRRAQQHARQHDREEQRNHAMALNS